jgi:hypothetical protein
MWVTPNRARALAARELPSSWTEESAIGESMGFQRRVENKMKLLIDRNE